MNNVAVSDTEEQDLSPEDILTSAAEHAADHLTSARSHLDDCEWDAAAARALTGLLELGLGVLSADLQE